MHRRDRSRGAVRLDVIALVAVIVMVTVFLAVAASTMMGGRDGDVYD